MKRHYQPEKSTEKIVRSAFFKRDPLTCARELIGTELIWGQCSGIVVEVEAYAAIDDEAAHTFTRPSARSFIERNKAGARVRLFQLRRSLDVKRAGEGRRGRLCFDSRARATARG